MSSHLCWAIIRNNNAYLLKKRNIRRPFSTVFRLPQELVRICAHVAQNSTLDTRLNSFVGKRVFQTPAAQFKCQEPSNLVNLSSYKYNGLIHKRSVGVIAAPDNKGFTVVYKKRKAVNKPAKSLVKRTMKTGPRRSLYKLKRLMNCNRYRRDLAKATLRRASAVIKSQKPLPVKKARSKKSE